jgi:hypothetical protein
MSYDAFMVESYDKKYSRKHPKETLLKNGLFADDELKHALYDMKKKGHLEQGFDIYINTGIKVSYDRDKDPKVKKFDILELFPYAPGQI